MSPHANDRGPLRGDRPAKEGELDAFDPENVALLVAFLANDRAFEISGQTFGVIDGSVLVMRGLHPAGSVQRNSKWTPQELAENKSELFATHPCEVPPNPF